jgi:hypothetical protein
MQDCRLSMVQDSTQRRNNMSNPNQDYYAWAVETAEKIRQRRFTEINLDDLAEEIEDMGVSERNELENRLAVLLAHLLKWQYQSSHRGRSWQLTIKEQRLAIKSRLRKSPSLYPRLPDIGEKDSYPRAVLRAERESGLPEDAFPTTFEQTGWSWEQVLEDEFYPE